MLTTFITTAWAGCSSTQGAYIFDGKLPAGLTINLPQNNKLGPIGNVISLPSGNSVSIVCTPGAAQTILTFGTNMIQSQYSADVYETNVPGIGVKIWDDFMAPTVVIGNEMKSWYILNSGFSGFAYLTKVKLQFYVIGPVSPGNIHLPPSTVEAWFNSVANGISSEGGVRYNVMNITGTVAVKVSSCETPDIKVDLKKHDSSEFSGVGSTSSNPTPFDFKINNCGSGLSGVYYTFMPAAGVSLEGTGNSQHITLNSNSTAKGVGIQVKYADGSNIPFNTKTKFTGYKGTGSYTIPMKAQYIQTENKITGGTANSAVEFTMNYE